MKFGELNIWDIFETETGDYYLKVETNNGFNAILLTGKQVECEYFNDDVDVTKF